MTGNLKLFCILILLSTGEAFSQDDPSPAISNAVNSGNSKALSRYFNEMVDLNIPGYKANYSKTQSERIIKNFFSKCPVKSFLISRQGTSPDGSKFSIGMLDAGNKKFRLYYLYRKANKVYLIFQFQIQEEM
jgi:hypothetical protein